MRDYIIKALCVLGAAASIAVCVEYVHPQPFGLDAQVRPWDYPLKQVYTLDVQLQPCWDCKRENQK
jgi:hypothetical protein